MMTAMLAGCGNSGGGTDGGSSDGGSSAGSNYDMTLIMAQRDEFLGELEAAAKAVASEVGVSLTTQDANSDTGKMLQYIETARNNGEKAIIINMVDPATAAQCVEAAGDMKVVFVNRYPTDPSVLNESAVYVGSDEMTSGKFQGDYLSELFKSQGKSEIRYILLNGILGQTSTENRTASLLQAFKDNGVTAIEAAAPLAADYDRATAQDMISPLVDTAEYDCIISNNDAMALGAIEALKSKNIDPTSIPIVGIDATADGRQAIKDGSMAMTVFQNPVGQGRGALLAAKNLVDGKNVAEGTGYETDETGNILWVPFEPVTIDNVADYE
ncbi:MAG: substrate-binding domain-containing protein [Eubacteriales bacterium]|nr:substrate-binding domain-containing protein [Eubacteriales bacterium]